MFVMYTHGNIVPLTDSTAVDIVGKSCNDLDLPDIENEIVLITNYILVKCKRIAFQYGTIHLDQIVKWSRDAIASLKKTDEKEDIKCRNSRGKIKRLG